MDNPSRMAFAPSGNRSGLRVGLGTLFVLGIIGLAQGATRDLSDSPVGEASAVSDAVNDTRAPELAIAKQFAAKLDALAVRGTPEAIEGLSAEELGTLIEEVVDLHAVSKEMSRLLTSEAEGRASAGLFRVTGEIKQRDAAKVVLWGYSLPVNFDSKQLGSMMGEGNLMVLNPDPDGILGGLRYDGIHAFLRTQEASNAFGGTVPVSVYGEIPSSTQSRIDDLREGERLLGDASSNLYRCYARVRRAILANDNNARAQPKELDSEAASKFILAVASSPFDQGSYFKGGKHPSGRLPLGWLNLRSDVPSQHLRGFTTGHDVGYGETGMILGFLGQKLAWRTRIHDRELLARYFPEAVLKLGNTALFSLPEGSEELVSVLLNADDRKRCKAMKTYTSSIVQNRQCPEVVNINLKREPSSESSEQISILCYWDGNTTRVLTSTIFEPGVASQDKLMFFNLNGVSANPLPFAW